MSFVLNWKRVGGLEREGRGYGWEAYVLIKICTRFAGMEVLSLLSSASLGDIVFVQNHL